MTRSETRKLTNLKLAKKHQTEMLEQGFKKQGFWASGKLQEKIEALMDSMDVQKKNELFTILIEEKYKKLHG